MDKDNELVLDAETLGALRASWKDTVSGLSPFLIGEEMSQEDGEKLLVKAGIFTEDGEVVEHLKDALEVVATAQAFTRLYFTNQLMNTSEHINYITADGRRATLTNVEGVYQLVHPDIGFDIVEGVRQNMGETLYKSCDLDVDLTPEESLTLAAMIDLQRKALMKAMVTGKGIEATTFDAKKVEAELMRAGDDFQWFKSIMKEILNKVVIEPKEFLDDALMGLVEKGIIAKKTKNYILGDEVVFLCRRMLVLDRFLSLTCGKMEDNEIIIAGFTCVQSGVHDILLIDASEERVHLESVSSNYILDYVTYLMHGDFLFEGEKGERKRYPPPPDDWD